MRRWILVLMLASACAPRDGLVQVVAPPVSREATEATVWTAWQAAAQIAAAPQGGQPTSPLAAPSAKRIGDTTVLTDPAGLRLAVTVNAFEDNATSSNRYSGPP